MKLFYFGALDDKQLSDVLEHCRVRLLARRFFRGEVGELRAGIKAAEREIRLRRSSRRKR